MYILQLSNSTWLLVSFWSGVVLFWIQHLPCLDSFRCMLWKYCGFFTKDHIISSLKVNLILACQEVLKWVWPKMNWTTLYFFIQIYTLPPSMDKWKENIDVRVILDSTGFLVKSWLFCIQYFTCLVTYQCMLGVGVGGWMKNILYWFMGGNFILAPLHMSKWSLASMNQ